MQKSKKIFLQIQFNSPQDYERVRERAASLGLPISTFSRLAIMKAMSEDSLTIAPKKQEGK